MAKRFPVIVVFLLFCIVWLGCGLGENVPPPDARVYHIMQERANELGALQVKVALDPSKAITGKTAIVEHWNNSDLEKPEDFRIEGFTQYFDGIAPAKVLNIWGLKPDTVPTKPSEIETLVRIGCTNGARIADFKVERRAPVPAYAIECLVEMIDYKSATAFSQRAFRNSTIEPDRKVLPIDEKVVARPPYDEITGYIRNFKRNQ
ncbi:MAG: hypothetical protein KF756_01335 [Acidobacteria bacterium]|nr:hypothetical protein [Acidobacteriota bacterium]